MTDMTIVKLRRALAVARSVQRNLHLQVHPSRVEMRTATGVVMILETAIYLIRKNPNRPIMVGQLFVASFAGVIRLYE